MKEEAHIINAITRVVFGKETLQKEYALVLAKLIDTHYRDESLSKKILSNFSVKSYLPQIREKLQKYERGFEKTYVKQFLRNGMHMADKYIAKQYGLIQREGKMAAIAKNTNVVHLGSGALPVTAIVINKLYHAPITCIDIDPKAIELSSTFIAKTGLSNITVKLADAFSYPLYMFDLVIITCSIEKNKELFLHAGNSGRKNRKILFRDPIGLYKLWYKEHSPNDLQGFTIQASDDHNKQWLAQSTVITKE